MSSSLRPSATGQVEGVDAAADSPHALRTLLILLLASMSYVLAQTMIIPALGSMAIGLGTTISGATWSLTAFLLVSAVMTPVLGRLGDMFGKRRMLVVALACLAVGGAVAALSGSLLFVILGRALQGVSGGVFPLCFGIVRDEFTPALRARSIGLISAVGSAGAGLGLVLGGLLIDHASYHWSLIIGAVSAAVIAVLAHRFVPESSVLSPGRVDYGGAVLLGIGVTAPLVAISQANSWGWTNERTLGLIAFGILVLALFVRYEQHHDEPLVHIPTLRLPTVLMTNVVTLFVGFGLLDALLIVPPLAEASPSGGYGFGASATAVGLILLPAGLSSMIASPFSGILSDRFGSKVPLSAGALLTAVGLGTLAVQHSSVAAISVWCVVAFFGMGLSFAAMANLIVDAVPVARTGESTGVNSTVRTIGSSLGAQVVATLLAAGALSGGGGTSPSSFGTAFALGAVVSAAAGVLAAFIPRPRGIRQPQAAPLDKAITR